MDVMDGLLDLRKSILIIAFKRVGQGNLPQKEKEEHYGNIGKYMGFIKSAAF